MNLGPLLKELTDWHNLLQGALGSFVGAVLAVLGAFWAATRTIRGQLESDRALAREVRLGDAARIALVRLGASEAALLRLASATQLAPSKVHKSWTDLEAANMAMLDERLVIDAQLPAELVADLNEVDRRTFALFEYFVARESIPDHWGREVPGRAALDPVGRAAMYAHDSITIAKPKFQALLGDPEVTVVSLEAAARRRRKRRHLLRGA